MNIPSEPDACTAWDNTTCEGTKFCPPRCPRVTADEGTSYLVRPYQRGDFDSIVEMYVQLDESATTMGLPPFTQSGIEDWVLELTADGWNLVATIDDRVVGHVAVTPADADDPEFLVFVHTDFHDRGIGTE